MPSSQGKASKEKNISTQETNQPNKRINPGFILDGFPRTQRQAVLLEKALRGQELCLESNKSAYVSIIASPPDSVCIFCETIQSYIILKCSEINKFDLIRANTKCKCDRSIYLTHIGYMT